MLLDNCFEVIRFLDNIDRELSADRLPEKQFDCVILRGYYPLPAVFQKSLRNSKGRKIHSFCLLFLSEANHENDNYHFGNPVHGCCFAGCMGRRHDEP
jgi:hypothetical protein